MPGLRKKPSTCELIDWISALAGGGVPPDEVGRRIPFIGALLKKEQDVDLTVKALERNRR